MLDLLGQSTPPLILNLTFKINILMVLINIRPHIRPHKSCFSSVNLQNACVRAFFAPNTPLPFKRALARDRCNRLVNYGPPRAPATVIVTVIRLARPRATLSLNVIPRFPRVRTRLAFLSPLSGVGGRWRIYR